MTTTTTTKTQQKPSPSIEDIFFSRCSADYRWTAVNAALPISGWINYAIRGQEGAGREGQINSFNKG